MKSVFSLVAVLTMLYFSPTIVMAADICKVTDPETGSATFTECAKASQNAVEVNMEPVNTMKSSDITRGKDFVRSTRNQEQSRKQNKRQMNVKRKTAEERLAAAKVIRPNDRVNTANGSRLSQAYLDRVKRAEEEYKQSK